MVDTLDLYYRFPSREAYDLCYQSVDRLSRKVGQAIHRDGKNSLYLTTAFSQLGILRMAFSKKNGYLCYMQIHPIRFLHPNCHLGLSTLSDYPTIVKQGNAFLSAINQVATETILLPIEYWHIVRIDYAFDLETPFVSEYIRLFKAGNIPNGFSGPDDYETSVYYKSANCNINIYDKICQVRKVFKLSDDDIAAEIGHLPEGILRIEVQCHSDYIQYWKNHHIIQENTLPYLFNSERAKKVLRRRVASLIGKTDFFPYTTCEGRLSEKYKYKTALACCSVLRDLLKIKGLSLGELRRKHDKQQHGNYFDQIIHKIRKAGVNPIPLDLAYENGQTCRTLPSLKNPLVYIDFSAEYRIRKAGFQ